MSAPLPWKRLRRGLEHDFSVLKVREDIVADPRNHREHPRVSLLCPDWVNVVAYTRADEAVLIRQFRTGVWASTLEIPGGMVDAGEEPLAAALRELEEETGYVAGRVLALGSVHPNPALQANRCHTFLALGCERRGRVHLDAGEDIAVELCPRAQVAALVRSGEITHALVVAAFHLEALHAAAPG
jgi:ADP-ribose pyrophosphatase